MYICSMYSKELLKGTLETMILKLLSENGRMYGYEVAQKIKELSEGYILVKDGSLYPSLHKLLVDGHITVEEEAIGKRIRKYYSLTAKGEEQKVYKLKETFSFMKTLDKILFDPKLSMQC